MSSLDVQIILRLVDQLTGPARAASNSLRGVQSSMNGIARSGASTVAATRGITAIGRASTMAQASVGRLAATMRGLRASQMGMGGFGAGGAGMLAAFPLVAMVKNAANYESKLIDIRKVWTGAADDYEKVVTGLKRLHGEIPLSRIEIGKVLEEGVRAGVSKNPAELLDFTRAAAAFSVAFTLPIDEAAPKLAKIVSSLGMTANEFTSVGDTMNTLAGSMSVNELEMLEFVRRVGGLAKSIGGQKGLDDMLAIGAAQMAAGTPKEVAATGLRTLIARLSTQPADTKKAIKALGFDPETIKKSLPEDMFGTIFKLIDKISQAPKSEQAGFLSQLAGMKSFDAFARLLTSTDLMIQALKTVRGEFRLTMQSELIRRVGSLNSAFQITSNLLGDLGDSIVMAWRPQIQWVLTKLQEMSVAMKGSPVLQWAAGIVAGAAALSLLAIPFGILGGSIFSAVLGLRALGSVLGAVSLIARPFIGILQGVFRGLSSIGPELAVVYRAAGAVAALAAAFRLLMVFTGIGAALVAIVTFFPAIRAIASGFWSGLKTGWEGSEVQRAFQWLGQWLPDISGLLSSIKSALDFLFDLGSLDNSTLASFFDNAAAAAHRLLNPMQGIRDLIGSLPSFDLSSLVGGGSGKNGALAGAAAAVGGGVGRFAMLPKNITMPPSIAPGPVTNNNQKTVNVGGISVTVNAQTNADPGAIGAAAAGAVGAKVRGALQDGGQH